MSDLAENEYRCAACGGIFTKGWSDEEAEEERLALFAEVPIEETELVCDDCWKAMGFE